MNQHARRYWSVCVGAWLLAGTSGVDPLLPMADNSALIVANGISVDGVQLNFLAPAEPMEFVETDGQPVDHIAFSVPDLDAMFDHVEGLGVEVISGPDDTELGFRSFFVRAPQRALIELVEAGPVMLP